MYGISSRIYGICDNMCAIKQHVVSVQAPGLRGAPLAPGGSPLPEPQGLGVATFIIMSLTISFSFSN